MRCGTPPLSSPARITDTAECAAQLIVDNMSVHGWATDPSGKFVYLSPSAVKYLGLSAEELGRIDASDGSGWTQVVHADNHDSVSKRWLRSFKNGGPFEIELRLHSCDESYRWFRLVGQAVRDDAGLIAGWYGTSIDIDEQKTAEIALRDREHQLEQLVDMVPTFIWSAAPDGEPIYINKRMKEWIGDALDDFVSPDVIRRAKALDILLHPDDRLAVGEELARSFSVGEPFAMKYRIRTADNIYRWIEGRTEALRDEMGNVAQWYGLCVDIDDLVRAKDVLRDREQQFSQLVDKVPILIWQLTPDGEPTYFNKRLVDYCGLDVDEIGAPGISRLAATIASIVHRDDTVELNAALNRSFTTGESFSMKYRLRRADGEYRWIEGRAEPVRNRDGSITQWYGLCFDIQDETLAQEALLERERQLLQIIDTVPALIWSVMPDGEPSYYNKRLAEWFGVSLADFDTPGISRLMSAAQTVIHPDDQIAVDVALKRSLATGEPFAMKYRNRRADGVYRWTEGRAEPLRDHGGVIVQWYGVCLDIDDLMRTEESLRDREQELTRLVDTVPTLIWRLTPDGEPSYFNKQLVDYCGLDVDDVDAADMSRLAAIIRAVIHPDDAASLDESLRRCLSTGELFSHKYRVRRADGVYRWVVGRASPMRNQDGRIIQWYGLCFDIEDEVQSQKMLRERERQLSLINDTVPVLIWTLTPDGQPYYYNKRLVDWMGVAVEDLDTPEMSRMALAMMTLIHPDDRVSVDETLGRCVRSGVPFAMKYRVRRIDGVYRWMEGRAEPLRDRDGTIVQWYGVLLDIDGLIRAEMSLRQSEQYLQQLIDAVPALIWLRTADGEPYYFNKRLVDWIGLDVDDLDTSSGSRLSAVIKAIIHPDDADGMAEDLRRSLDAGEPFARRYRVRHCTGEYRWSYARSEPLRNERGEIVRWLGVTLDIDDQVRAETALRKSEQYLRQLIDTVPALIWLRTPDGEPSYYNKRLVDLTGMEVEDPDTPGISRVSATIKAVIHPDDAAGMEEALKRSFDAGEPFARKYRIRLCTGDYRWVQARSEPLRDEKGNILSWLGVDLDIDDQVRAETALRQSERQLRQLVDTVPALIWLLNPDGEPSYYNKRLVDWFGLDVEDVDTPGDSRIEATIKAVVHPDDMLGVDYALKRSLATGEPYARKYRLRRNDGVYRWIEARAEPLWGQDGRIVQWYGVCLDIDEEVRAQAALRERERQLSQLIDTVPSLIWCLDVNGQPSYYNKRLVEWLGFGVGDLDRDAPSKLTAAIESIVHPDYRIAVGEALARCFSNGEPFEMKYPQRNADGVYRWTEGRLEPLRNEDGAIVHWYGVLLDIEDEVRGQEALLRAQDRLARATQAASLAELSASIAHEVNQPLAAVVANAGACHRWLSADPPNIERARIIADRMIRDANSACEVVSHIRALFRQTTQARAAGDVNQVIAEACKLLGSEIAAKNIHVETKLDQDLPEAIIDRVQIQQVFINLIRNGIDALAENHEGKKTLRIRSCCDGDSILIEVIDNGTGVKEIDRIFEPFFTTKGDGMGMGLAICRSIVEAHQGRMWAANNQTRGATLACTLPRANVS